MVSPEAALAPLPSIRDRRGDLISDSFRQMEAAAMGTKIDSWGQPHLDAHAAPSLQQLTPPSIAFALHFLCTCFAWGQEKHSQHRLSYMTAGGPAYAGQWAGGPWLDQRG